MTSLRYCKELFTEINHYFFHYQTSGEVPVVHPEAVRRGGLERGAAAGHAPGAGLPAAELPAAAPQVHTDGRLHVPRCLKWRLRVYFYR